MKERVTLLMLLRRVQGLVAGLVETVTRSRNHTVFSQPAVCVVGHVVASATIPALGVVRLFVICQGTW
jgi:hypothetical protein